MIKMIFRQKINESGKEEKKSYRNEMDELIFIRMTLDGNYKPSIEQLLSFYGIKSRLS